MIVSISRLAKLYDAIHNPITELRCENHAAPSVEEMDILLAKLENDIKEKIIKALNLQTS